MFNLLLAEQIPQFWELIKYAVAKVYAIKPEDFPVIFNDILQALLASKYQVFIKRSDDGEKKVEAIQISEINVHKITGYKSLNLVCLYSFKYMDTDGWKDFFEFALKFAKSQQCKSITTESRNHRVWEIVKALGFEETVRLFTYKIDGGE